MSRNVWKTSSVVMGVMLFGLVVGVADARADEEIVAKVPFAFSVGKTHFAPGDYIVKTISDDLSLMEIVSTDRTEVTIAMTLPASAEHDGTQRPGLVFTKVGGDYVLSRIVAADGDDREFAVPAQREVHIDTGAAR